MTDDKAGFTRKDIIDIFGKLSILLVDFIKVDGTERSMLCTRDFDFIPNELHPSAKNDKPINEDVVVVYDLEARGWRSFRVDSVINIVVDYV